MSRNVLGSKLAIVLISLLALGLVSIVGWTIVQKSEGYTQKEIIFAPWGSGRSAIGVIEERTNEAGFDYTWRGGPTNIDTDKDGNIYIGDSVNKRIAKYSEQGELIQNVSVARESSASLNQFQVDQKGNIYTVESTVNEKRAIVRQRLAKYDSTGRLLNYIDISQLTLQRPYLDYLTIKGDDIYLHTAFWRQAVRIGSVRGQLRVLSGAEHLTKGMPLESSAHLYYGPLKGDNAYRLRVFDQNGMETSILDVRIPNAIVGFATDKYRNIYLIADLTDHPHRDLLASSELRIEIHKYDSNSKLLDSIESYGEYWTMVNRKIEVDDQGNIYQLSTNQDGLSVVKWESEATR